MAELKMLRGLVASGKSTEAKRLVSKGWTRVNFDDFRAMGHNSKWTRSNEAIIQHAAYAMVDEALSRNRDVVWDNTSFAPKHEQRLRELAKKHDAEFRIQDFEVSLQEAIERDLKRERSVGPKVIREMYYRYCYTPPEPPVNPDLRWGWIVDIDGTLAQMQQGGRSPFQWDRVGEDAPIKPVIDLVVSLYSDQNIVTLLSGRDSAAREPTEHWLKEHSIPYHYLFMRAEGDMRKDSIVKRELHDNEVSRVMNVRGVIDDREQVVHLWSHDLGYPVLQVRMPGVNNDF